MLSDGEHNLADTAADSSADATPHSPRPAPPRRAVPTTFNPIINDEANILAAISRGDRTIFDLAEEHGTTVANFAVWLQREDIQQKLNDLTSAGTILTRVAAVNQLPKAVKAMAFQIEAHIFARTHNLIQPGLAADKISALRDANARKACNLLLRLAKFDPAQPLYRKRERTESSTLAPQGLAQRGEVASAQHEPVRGDPAGLPCPSPQLDILDLCAAALAAVHSARESHASDLPDSEGRGRAGEPSGSPATSTDQGRSGWRGNGKIPAAISILSNDPTRRLPVENQNHKHNGHTNSRVVRHTKSSESPPKSRPPPSH